MAQPARQMTEREYVRRQRVNQTQSESINLPKRRITKGEKVLWTMTVMILLIFGIMIVAKQAVIYESSRSISETENKIEAIEKANKDLTVQIQNLQSPDRIIKIAKEQGLKLNTENVKVVNK